jgi:CubicO group peptidase (beta-lactamase class C family)
MNPAASNPLFQLLQELTLNPAQRSAAQLVVRHKGRIIADFTISAEDQITSKTPFLTFSVSKGFTGMCVLRLIEEGKVDMDAPVSTYWPEFGCNGKENATIRHVFLHQAGIPAPHLRQQVFFWPFWPLVVRNVAREKALFPPGSQTAYHLMNYGFIFGEVIRRVTGLPVNVYLQHTFLEPMGLKNTWMRLPLTELRYSPRLQTSAPSMLEACRLFNHAIIRTALLPAASLHSTAQDLAAFFQMLLDSGEFAGKRLLSPESVLQAVTTGSDGWDSYLKNHLRRGYGMQLGSSATSSSDPEKRVMGKGSSERTFGVFGMGTCMVWADPDANLAAAYTTNQMLSDEDANLRWSTISNAIWDFARDM